MNFDLAQLIKRVGRTRQKHIVAPRITPTAAQKQDLQALYMRVVRAWGRLVLERIMPAYERTLAEGMRDSVDDVQGEIDEAQAALTRLVLTLDAALEDWAVRVEEWHRKRFGTLFTPVGVRLDTLLSRGDVTTTLQAVLGDNLSLIRSLNDQMRNGISGAVFRGLSNRTPAREVGREIRNTTGIGTRRAELIAADQLQKLTSRLDEERQRQAGIGKFEWAHSGKKFPRPEHIARDGKIYSWDSEVAKSDPPGRAIQCGCRARAVLELDDEAPAIEEPVTPRTIRSLEASAKKHVLSNGRREGVEHLAAYDAATGRKFTANRGTRNSSALTDDMVAAIAKPSSRVVFHHNHPSSSSLSAPDLDLLEKPGLKGIWAHGHNGSSFYAERKGKAPTRQELRTAQGEVHAKMQALVSGAVLDIEAAQLLHNHISWLLLQKRGRLEYQSTLAGPSKAAWEKYEGLITVLLESFR